MQGGSVVGARIKRINDPEVFISVSVIFHKKHPDCNNLDKWSIFIKRKNYTGDVLILLPRIISETL